MMSPTQTRKLGSLDFVRMIYNGHPEYSLLAVKAPIEDVVAAWIELREGQLTRSRRHWRSMTVKTDQLASRQVIWETNIAILPEGSDDGELENAMHVPFIQVADSEWVVIIRSLSWLDSEQLDNVPKEAKFLAEKFQTCAFTMMEEDTSSAVSYELFERGELIESLEFCDAEEYRFTSQRQDDPNFESEDKEFDDASVSELEDDEDCESIFEFELEDDDDDEDSYDVGKRHEMQFIDRIVAEIGLYIPAVWYSATQGKPAIQVMAASTGTVARADWLTIQETWEIEPVVVNDDDAE